MTVTLSYIIGISIVGILFALWGRSRIARSPDGNEKMKAIAEAIREGSRAYLKRQYQYVAVVAIVLAVVLGFFLTWTTAIGFLVGATASALAGYLGMMTSVLANVRVAEAAKKGLAPAFKLAFQGGSVTGFLVVGLGLLVVAGFWFLTRDI